MKSAQYNFFLPAGYWSAWFCTALKSAAYGAFPLIFAELCFPISGSILDAGVAGIKKGLWLLRLCCARLQHRGHERYNKALDFLHYCHKSGLCIARLQKGL